MTANINTEQIANGYTSLAATKAFIDCGLDAKLSELFVKSRPGDSAKPDESFSFGVSRATDGYAYLIAQVASARSSYAVNLEDGTIGHSGKDQFLDSRQLGVVRQLLGIPAVPTPTTSQALDLASEHISYTPPVVRGD